MFAHIRPLLFALDPERAHRIALRAVRAAPRRPAALAPPLASRVAGLSFPNPIGLAAGFDKDAEAVDAMLGLGFGFVEVGTLTPLPQPGNPRPRLFRLVADRGVVNRMGFNNRGQASAHARLAQRRARSAAGIVGVNIGANKDSVDRIADYVAGMRAMAGVADYLTINISSPNTPGLRALQAGAELGALLGALAAARAPETPPLFVKVAPDLDEIEAHRITEAALRHGIDGLIVANTTVSRPRLASPQASEAGGLSGAPLAPLAARTLCWFAEAAHGALPLIAAGGIASATDAYARIRAGASLVQLYTALVYDGPGLARRIASDLTDLLRADGFASVADAVGVEPGNCRDL